MLKNLIFKITNSNKKLKQLIEKLEYCKKKEKSFAQDSVRIHHRKEHRSPPNLNLNLILPKIQPSPNPSSSHYINVPSNLTRPSSQSHR